MKKNKNVCDTVILFIPHNDALYRLRDPLRFLPPANEFYKSPYMEKSVCNPRSEELQRHYMPQVTLTRRFCGKARSVGLLISFSAPKIVFDTNLLEVGDEDFDTLISNLKERLEEMGVLVTEDALRTAEVVTIHYGKNIDLSNISSGIAPCLIVQEISRWNPFVRMDVMKATYLDNGSQVRFHSSKLDVTVYDKTKEALADIKKLKKYKEASAISDALYDSQKLRQIFRLEIRLGSCRKIREVIKDATGEELEDLKFFRLFNSDYAKAVNSLFWQRMKRGRRPYLLTEENSDKQLLTLLRCFKPLKALQVLGVVNALKFATKQELLNQTGNNPTVRNVFRSLEKMNIIGNFTDRLIEKIGKEIEINGETP